MTEPLYDGKALVDMLREQIDASKDEAPDLHGATVRYAKTRQTFEERVEQLKAQRPGAVSAGGGTGTWVYAATGKVVGGGGVGGGGGSGNASPNQATVSVGHGGHGGLSVLCRTCGEPATRFSPLGECLACTNSPARRRYYVAERQRLDAATAQQHDAHVRARAAQPVRPERRFCACGQEVYAQGWLRECGDCRSMEHRYTYPRHNGDLEGGRDVATAKTLDARIAAAQKPDADPTQAWGAGATPSYDWEGT